MAWLNGLAASEPSHDNTRCRVVEIVPNMGNTARLRGSASVPVRAIRRASAFLAEVLMFKGMGVGNVGMTTREEVMVLVSSVGITTFE